MQIILSRKHNFIMKVKNQNLGSASNFITSIKIISLSTMQVSVILFFLSGCVSQEKKSSINDGLQTKSKKSLTYLSETDPSYAYLAHLQSTASLFGPVQVLPDRDDQRTEVLYTKLKAHFEKNGRVLTREDFDAIFIGEAPTPYQNPGAYRLLKHFFQEIEKAGKEINLPLKQQLKFGTIGSTALNARTYPVPGSEEAIIVFNTRLLSFSHEMAKLALQTVEFQQKGDSLILSYTDETAERLIANDPKIVERFWRTILDFLMVMKYDEQFFSSGEHALHDPLLSELRDGMEIFAASHEYSHIALEHFSNDREWLKLPSSTNVPPIQYLKRSWFEELSADMAGMKLLAKVIDNERMENQAAYDLTEIGKSGGEFLLLCMLVAENARALVDTGEEMPTDIKKDAERLKAIMAALEKKDWSGLNDAELWKGAGEHPPSWMRAKFVQAVRFDLTPTQMTPDQHQFFMLGEELRKRLVLLWERSVPELKRVHELTKILKKGDGNEHTPKE